MAVLLAPSPTLPGYKGEKVVPLTEHLLVEMGGPLLREDTGQTLEAFYQGHLLTPQPHVPVHAAQRGLWPGTDSPGPSALGGDKRSPAGAMQSGQSLG